MVVRLRSVAVVAAMAWAVAACGEGTVDDVPESGESTESSVPEAAVPLLRPRAFVPATPAAAV